jgi:hypothetical protein
LNDWLEEKQKKRKKREKIDVFIIITFFCKSKEDNKQQAF